ncbi:hypothetical protein HK102_010672 [Quaeritorhiza haematococci]|nr:hypothetical protein HK102_010672 [Quaeritorhiza haematococci]
MEVVQPTPQLTITEETKEPTLLESHDPTDEPANNDINNGEQAKIPKGFSNTIILVLMMFFSSLETSMGLIAADIFSTIVTAPPRRMSTSVLGARENNTFGPSPLSPGLVHGRRFSQPALMNADLLSKNKDPKDPEHQLRQLRLQKVLNKRHDRINVHLENFMRINVVISPTVRFPLTVDVRQTIEYLSTQIEAEYAHRYLLPPKGQTIPEALELQPLECGLLYKSSTMVAFRFQDRIGDVLDMDDDVHVMNVFEAKIRHIHVTKALTKEAESGEDPQQDSSTSPESSAPALNLSAGAQLFRSAAYGSSLNSDLKPGRSMSALSSRNALRLSRGFTSMSGISNHQSPKGLKSVGFNPNPIVITHSEPSLYSSIEKDNYNKMDLDESMQSLLYNRMALECFMEFCVEQLCIESLMFWLEVELFQTIEASRRLLYAKYIYVVYVASGAPLQVNLSEEIRREVPWPPAQHGKCDKAMFDEAQEYVYATLRGYALYRFGQSGKFQALQAAIEKDPNVFDQAQITDALSKVYDPRFGLCENIILLLDPESASMSAAKLGLSSWNLGGSDQSLRDQILSYVIQKYFPQSTYGTVKGYFDAMARVTSTQRKRKLKKEKKLAKFFGQKPSQELIHRQMMGSEVVKVEVKDQNMSLTLTTHSTDSLLGMDGTHHVTGSKESIDNGVYSKKKKVEKLQGFFGDKLSKRELRMQHLSTVSVSSNSTSSVASSENDVRVPPPMQNDLDPLQKRELQKKHKKLASMLGEKLDEITVNQLLNSSGGKGQLENPAISSTIHLTMSLSRSKSGDFNRPTPLVKGENESMLQIYLGRGRRASDGSMKTTRTDVSGSSMSMNRYKASREYRRRKIQKLSQFLGERITDLQLLETAAASNTNGNANTNANNTTTNILSAMSLPIPSTKTVQNETSNEPQQMPARSLHPKVRQATRKRVNKLERVFGQVPPVSLVVDKELSNGIRMADHHRNSIYKIRMILENEKDILDLIDTMAEFDMGSELAPIESPAPSPIDAVPRTSAESGTNNSTIVPTATESLAALPSGSVGGSVLLNSSNGGTGTRPQNVHNKNARQRKLTKLQKFFGAKISLDLLLEQCVVDDLERAIEEDVDDPVELSELKRGVAMLRQQIRTRTISLDSDSMAETSAEDVDPQSSQPEDMSSDMNALSDSGTAVST